MTAVVWLVVFVILVGIEIMTMALTTIWFAGGALAAFFAAVADLSVKPSWWFFWRFRLCFSFLQGRLPPGTSTKAP